MELCDLITDRDRDGFIVLKRTFSELYKKTYWTTPLTLVQNRIYEYDIRSANLTMLRRSGKIKESTLAMLDGVDKQSREEAVGKMIRQNKKFYKIISRGIYEAREMLFRMNQLQDYEVLSIKNDAVFVIGRKLKYTQFGDIEFRVKNQYAIFQQVEKTEIYYDRRHQTIDIKGVNDAVVEHEDHQNGIIQFFKQVSEYLVYDQRQALREYLIDFSQQYKSKRLNHEYYREFNSDNIYRTIMELSGFSYNLTEAGNSDLGIINPVYNYKRYILPMIRLYI